MKIIWSWASARNLVRGVCGVCAILMLLGLFAPQSLRSLQPLGGSHPRPQERLPAESVSSSESNHVPSPNAARTGDTERTPLVEALSDLVGQNQQVFGPVQAQLQDNLEQANARLLDVKRTNQAALRQAHRRVRRPGLAPHLLLVIIQGLNCDALHCYHEQAEATPGFDRLAANGLRLTQYSSPETEATDWARLFGGSDLENGRAGNRRSPSFAALLWESGYATALIGDMPKPQTSLSELGFDHWSGCSSPRDALDEALAFTARTARQRPVASLVLLNGRGQSVPAQDELMSWLLAQLDERHLAASTLLVVVGIPARESTSRPPLATASPPVAPGFAVWLDQLPKGSVNDQATTLADIVCTLLTLAEIPQRPARLKGTSRWELWRNGSPPE